MPKFGRGWLFLALPLAACGSNEQEDRLYDTYGLAVHALRDIGRNPMAQASYQSAIESGATPVDYVIISLPENAKIVPLVWQGPSKRWTVVIKEGPGNDDFIVEAYADELSAPVKSEIVDLSAPKR